MATRFDLVGRLDGIKRTPQGGIQATANLTRTGVFVYYDNDGTRVRELRHPDDVFKTDALETLKSAPLTVGHPGMVTAENYKALAVGHVLTDVHQAGRFVRATVVVQDAKTCAAIERGELVELSCGYEVEVLKEDGEFDGERYDARQVGHKYNHVALGPSNWGRAGAEVRLHLDSAGNALANSYAGDMTIRTDDNADKALKERCDAQAAEIESLTGERDALKAELETERAKVAELSNEIARVKSDNATFVDPKEIPALVSARVSLETSARTILGSEFKGDGKSDRDVMVEALAKARPELKCDGRADEYVRACFDTAVESAQRADAAIVNLNAATAPKDPPKSRIDEAEDKRKADLEAQAKAGAPAGALTRK